MAFYDRFKRHLAKTEFVRKAEMPDDAQSWPAGQGYQPDHQSAHDEAGQRVSEAMDIGDQQRTQVTAMMAELKNAQKVLTNCIASIGTLGQQQNDIRTQYGDDPDETSAEKVQAMQGVVDAIAAFNDAVHEHLK